MTDDQQPVNRELFARIHKLIMDFPELHAQHNWQTNPEQTGNCGTTRCVAGWAVWIAARDAGLLQRKRHLVGTATLMELARRLGLTEGDLDADFYYGDYTVDTFPVLGGQLLGLSGEQALSLFHDMNDKRVADRVQSFALTGEDIPEEEYDSYES